MRYFIILFALLLLSSTASAEDGVSLNLQYHYDVRRGHPTVTQEFFSADPLGYTFFFMDVNFDHTRKKAGISDVYLEFFRYFKLYQIDAYPLYLTIQYNDGTPPIERVILGGLNMGNIGLGPFNISAEFLLKKAYQLDTDWQITVVWFAELLQGKLILNGYLDYWMNDTDNSHWPSGAVAPEIAASRYSFQAEPQIGWRFTSHWKAGSELEISRGFIGSVTGELAKEEQYRHDKWYVLPTLFVQYDF